ncbi:hypothetical protein [Natrinema versiforme]|uniref:Uncharacterized protein n=1 Tax=Natrinema versiforme JCM 10478 TaxID=1227496 RepID=L9Y6Q0_9EURY|nr:hypothetical protein [Natrinema versiforme]ELY69331.1 hypothetical protein C489_05238 [Natrinema versiforme JCM 10478]
MVSEQFSQAVRGSGGDPIDVSSSTGSLETNEYGSATSASASAYPITVDPAWQIEEVMFFALPDDKEVTATLEDGSSTTFEPKGPDWVLNTLEIDVLEITDPENSEGETSLLAVGD